MLQDRVYCLKIAADPPQGPNYGYQSKTNGQGIKLQMLSQRHMLTVKVKMSDVIELILSFTLQEHVLHDT